jgi:hypothetical protein
VQVSAAAAFRKLCAGERWLPDMDLNHDKQIQSLLCYRYTIGQTNATKIEAPPTESRLLQMDTWINGLMDKWIDGAASGMALPIAALIHPSTNPAI